MLINGTHSPELEKTLKTHVETVLSTKISKKPVTPTIPAEIVNPIIADIDDLLDQFYMSGFKKIPEIKYTGHCKTSQIQCAISYYSDLLEEVNSGGRKTLTAIQQTRYVTLLNNIIRHLDQSKPVVRKTIRKKRPVPAEKIISNLKFLKENELARSIDPKKIIVSTILWVYNVSSRRLSKYVAEKGAALSVKGTTIINYDPSLSYSKTVRKPGEIIPLLTKGSKARIQSIFKKLTTKQVSVRGRLNDQTILLRVFK
jgi:hypothetical protein